METYERIERIERIDVVERVPLVQPFFFVQWMIDLHLEILHLIDRIVVSIAAFIANAIIISFGLFVAKVFFDAFF